MKTQPTNLRTNERSETTRPIYIYAILHGTDLYHLTNLDTELSITGMAAAWGSDPETFLPCQISHNAISQQSEINANKMTLTIGLNDNAFAQALKSLVVSAVPKKITVIVGRLNPSALTSLDWSTDVYVIFKGRGTDLSFNRYSIQIGLVSLIMQQEGKVPRYFWQKTCQHILYSTACGVDETAVANRLSTTIAAVSARARIVDIADTTIDGNTITANTFQGGYVRITASGEKVSVVSSQIIGGGGGTRLYLGWWDDGLTAAAAITVNRGCLRTKDECNTTFSNLANFGGFPYIPDINPATQGIRTGENDT